jgi:hypothetical protein
MLCNIRSRKKKRRSISCQVGFLKLTFHIGTEGTEAITHICMSAKKTLFCVCERNAPGEKAIFTICEVVGNKKKVTMPDDETQRN